MAVISERNSDGAGGGRARGSNKSKKVPLCDMRYGPFSCITSFSQPLGFSGCSISEVRLPCARVSECLNEGDGQSRCSEGVSVSSAGGVYDLAAREGSGGGGAELSVAHGIASMSPGPPARGSFRGRDRDRDDEAAGTQQGRDAAARARAGTQTKAVQLRPFSSLDISGEGEDVNIFASGASFEGGSTASSPRRSLNGSMSAAAAARERYAEQLKAARPAAPGDAMLQGGASAKAAAAAAAAPAAKAASGKALPPSALKRAAQAVKARGPEVPSAVFEPVAAAVRLGRWVEAKRRLGRLEETGVDLLKGMSASMVERIRRIGMRFDESLRELSPSESDGWQKDCHKDLGIDFSFRLLNSTIQVVSSCVYTGFDALEGFAALCEFEQCRKFCFDVSLAQPLRERIHDGIWRVQRNAHGGREDNVVQVSCLDALDEPLGGLWLCVYTPAEEGLDELRGVPLPKPEEGTVRVGLWRSVFVITPIWALSAPAPAPPPEEEAGASDDAGAAAPAAPQQSFRLTFALCRRTTAAACCFPEIVVRREVGHVFEGLRKFLHEDRDLSNRVVFSRKAAFYHSIRRHLAEIAPPTAQLPPPPMLWLSFQDISRCIPEDWADSVEEVSTSVYCEMARRATTPQGVCSVAASFDSPENVL